MFIDSPFIVQYISNANLTFSFYTLLGAEIVEHIDSKVEVNIGGHEIHFILESTEPFAEYQYITKPEKRGQGVLFYIQTMNIEEVFYKISNSKFQKNIISSIKPNHWNHREFLVEDPDGYKLVFWGT